VASDAGTLGATATLLLHAAAAATDAAAAAYSQFVD